MRICCLFCSLALQLIFSLTCFAQTSEVARLDSAQGVVQARLGASADFKEVQVGQSFQVGDTVRTMAGTQAALVFSSGVLLRLAPGTSLTFQEQEASAQKISMQQGKGFFFSREPREFPVINSPAVTTAVRGTEFVIEVQAHNTLVSVLAGQVRCSNAYGSVDLAAGELANTAKGHAPQKALLLRPQDAVQWAVSYPLVLQAEQDQELQAVSRRLEQNFADADFEAALNQVDQARTKHAAHAARSAALSAQEAVLELARNNLSEASQNCEDIKASESDSLSVLLACSYVAQAARDLKQARALLLRATSKFPKSNMALLRLAEIELSFAELHKAAELVQAALSQQPDDAHANAIMGFVKLAQHHNQQARANFEAALQSNPQLALAHLGRGLTLIRDGELPAGRVELEKAVVFDPSVSIYRSYLGKAFFEEYREHLAGAEFERAIELDALDPTPFLYRAYNQLSANRLVESLQDIERSIALNHNRAVYRSSLLLDQDLGVRSASLSEVFSALGFTQAARIEAIKSINSDYSNFSAHQLLANSYNTLLLNDVGQSERQIASLLAPLSFNLFSAGSAAPSLNDYASLFDRDQVRSRVGIDASSYDDYLNPFASSAGKFGNFGYFASFDSIMGNGSKQNNFERRYKAASLLQYEINSDNHISLLVDGLYRKRFDDNQLNQEVRFETYNLALGLRSQISPQLTLLAESRWANDHSRFLEREAYRLTEFLVDIDGEELTFEDAALTDELSHQRVRSSRNTVQLIYDSDLVSTVFGHQAYFAEADREEFSPVLADELEFLQGLGFALDTAALNNLDAFDTYLYSTLHLSRSVDLTAGLTLSEIEFEDREITPFMHSSFKRSRLNPKLGASIYLSPELTLRAAYFESMRKSSLEDFAQLEPSLVGGINQRFTDLSGARSRNMGAGLDYKLAARSYVGLEALHRHIVDEYNDAITTVELDQDLYPIGSVGRLQERYDLHSEQDLAKAYYYQVLCRSMVSTLDYEYALGDRTDPALEQELKLHKIRPALRYFNPSGIFAFVSGTWREQEREGGNIYEDGKEDFWIVDLGVGYRLPRRSGSLSLELNNVFDEEFDYDQSLGFEEFVYEGIGMSFKANINF